MGLKILVAVILLLILPLAAVLIAIAMNRPMLWNPPGFTNRLSIYFRYNAAETTGNPFLPELRIRSYPVSEETMKGAVARTVRSLPGWTLIREEGELGVYQVEVASRLWGFRDDLSILVTRSASDGVEVYLYSASRVGRGDLGANRAHILTFYEALERRLKEGP